jgi:hypothetical protein
MNSNNKLLQEVILATVLCPTEPWLPELTEPVVDNGWRILMQELGISQATYSTTNVIRRASTVPTEGSLTSIPVRDNIFFGSLEILEEDVQGNFGSKEYRFLSSLEVTETGLAECFRSALELIALVPSLYASLRQLIKSVHVLQSCTENCDISFSDPAVPFSIFVSMPSKYSSAASLRLAEAIIHEAMHLQLSLVERITAIAFAGPPQHYSPWKQSKRNASGVLHALYVFTVIDSWLKQLPVSFEGYVSSRRGEIARQVAEIAPFEMAEVTEVGNALRKYLFSKH